MLLAVVGLVWFHKGGAYPIDFVTTLVLNVAMPALLFHTLVSAIVPLSELTRMASATIVVHILFVGLAIIVLKFCHKDWRLCVAHVVGNTGNLGLPVCFLAFGDEGLAYAMTFFAVQCILLFSLGDAIYAGSFNLTRLLKTPILHAIWLGLAARTLQIEPPAMIMQSAQLLGQLVIPIMLITLGVSLAGMRAAQLPSNLLWSAIRTVLAISVAFSVSAVMGLTGVARGVLIVETVVPVAVFNYLLAVKHGRDASEVSGMILITHLAAIGYLPIILSLVL